MVKLFKQAVVIGTIAGIVLGFILKWMEIQTSKKVYTLLLNIDFIPVVNEIHFGEVGEFVFHLLFSILLSVVYLTWMSKMRSKSLTKHLVYAFIITLPTVFLYFPLSLLAQKQVPGINDFHSIMYWTLGHIIYALVLGILAYLQHRKTRSF